MRREIVAPREVRVGACGREALGEAPGLEDPVVGAGVTQGRVPRAVQEADLAEQRRDPALGVLAPARLALVARSQVVVPHAVPRPHVRLELVAAVAPGRRLELARRRARAPPRHQVHGCAERVSAQQHRRPVHHLDALHVLERQQVEIDLVGVRLVGAHAVHVHRDPLRQPDHRRHLKAAERDVELTRRAQLVRRRDARQLLQGIRERAYAARVQILGSEHGSAPGEPARQVAHGGEAHARHDDGSEEGGVFGGGVGLLGADGCRQRAG